MQSLKKLISIDRNFQTAVNLRLDREDNFKFKGYIPTTSSTALMQQLLENVAEQRGKNASVVIGPYGKGKSHLLLVLLALLEQQFPKEQEEVLMKIGKVNPDCEVAARRVMKKGIYLTVLVSDNGGSLNTSLLLALKEALDRKGIPSLMPNSFFSEAERIILRWKQDFPDTYDRLWQFLQKMPEYEKEADSAEALTKRLRQYDEAALQVFTQIYPALTAGSVFSPMIHMEAVMLYREVNRALREQYGYCGIYLVFDEFSKYLEGHSGDKFAADMKVLQDMCELANASGEEEFALTLVTHKSMREYNGRFSKELQNQFRGVEGRLQEYLFVDSVRNQFDLVRNVLGKTPEFEKEYPQFAEAEGREILKKSYELPVFGIQFSEKEYEEIVAKGCFPLTPLTAVLLLSLCEKVAQNERTLFTFLANDEHNSVYEMIQRTGQDKAWYLGASALYDYFAPLFRESMDAPEIHQEWLKAEYALGQDLTPVEKKLVKTIAIMQIAGNRQEFPIQEGMIALAAGISKEETKQVVQKLTEKELLIWRSRLGCYAFKNNIGINLDKELSELIKKQPERLDVASKLADVSELEYLLPKSYNQNYTITRYFQYVFLSMDVFWQMAEPGYLFEEQFADGKLLALVDEQGADEKAIEKIQAKSKKWQDSRVIILFSKRRFSQQQNIRKVLALRQMLADKEFLEENRAVEQELKLYLEDIVFEINAFLEQNFLPGSGDCQVLWQGEIRQFANEKAFNAFLSEICGEYYAFSPKVNHELLNIQSVTGQYLRARNHVVDGILSQESMAAYERGTGPEAMIYRTALLRTGVIGKQFPKDIGTERILQEIRHFIQSSAERRQCFAVLYRKLEGKGYGARKGVLPIFLAMEYMQTAGTPVFYLESKEVPASTEIFNNINDRPGQYFLYLEQVEGEKEKYLDSLETYLRIDREGSGKQQRMQRIVESLQQKYRSLPKAVSNWKVYDADEWQEQFETMRSEDAEVVRNMADAKKLHEASEKLISLLRRVEINGRELLFEKIPSFFGKTEADEACAKAVELICNVWKMRLFRIKKQTAAKCLALWGAAPDENIGACLTQWYQKLGENIKKNIFTAKTTAFQTALNRMAGLSGEEAIAILGREITGLYMEDWLPETAQNFLEDMKNVKEELERSAPDNAETEGQKKVIFTDAQGKLVERSFRQEEDGVGVFLKNAIREAIEEFGDSMDTSQKVAVLVETLEEVLK